MKERKDPKSVKSGSNSNQSPTPEIANEISTFADHFIAKGKISKEQMQNVLDRKSHKKSWTQITEEGSALATRCHRCFKAEDLANRALKEKAQETKEFNSNKSRDQKVEEHACSPPTIVELTRRMLKDHPKETIELSFEVEKLPEDVREYIVNYDGQASWKKHPRCWFLVNDNGISFQKWKI